MYIDVTICSNKEIHVNAICQVAQLVKFVNCDVLQVDHLQHVGREERALQRVHVARVNSSTVNVAQDDGEDIFCNTMKINSLIPDQRYAHFLIKARQIQKGGKILNFCG